jgi:hypothetical protein
MKGMMIMQINSLGSVPSYNSNVQNISSGVIKNVPLPVKYGWGADSIPTGTKTNRSDDEIKNDLIELAKKDARRGVRGGDTNGYGKRSKEYDNLIGEYVMSVSPDRKSIYPAAMAQLQKATSIDNLFMPHIDYSMMELMLKGASVSIEHAGFEYDSGSKKLILRHVKFMLNGEHIGGYAHNHGGWNWSPTKAELERMQENLTTYDTAWKAERNQMERERSGKLSYSV